MSNDSNKRPELPANYARGGELRELVLASISDDWMRLETLHSSPELPLHDQKSLWRLLLDMSRWGDVEMRDTARLGVIEVRRLRKPLPQVL